MTTVIPGGRWTLRASDDRLAHDVLHSPVTDRPHPLLAFVAAQRGLGVSVPELFALFGADMADGPLLTDCDLDLPGDLRVGVTYEVCGEVLSVERKHGRTLGTFDLVTARFTITEPGAGAPAATVTNTYALRRPT